MSQINISSDWEQLRDSVTVIIAGIGDTVLPARGDDEWGKSVALHEGPHHDLCRDRPRNAVRLPLGNRATFRIRFPQEYLIHTHRHHLRNQRSRTFDPDGICRA